MATDTLPGLHCRADRSQAISRIAEIKGRPEGKTLLVLAGDLVQVQQMTGPLTAAQQAACRRCWPGPFSLILPADPELPPAVTGGGQTVAIRIPAVIALRKLILAVGYPLVSTSANLSGRKPATALGEVDSSITRSVDGVWGSDPDGSQPLVPSCLADLTTAPFRVLRPGPEPFLDS